MKTIFAVLISLFALSAFAGSAKETIAQIEAERNVKCEQKALGFQYCFGSVREAATCRHTETYVCSGAEDFGVKLTVKEFYNRRLGARQSVVSDIQFL